MNEGSLSGIGGLKNVAQQYENLEHGFTFDNWRLYELTLDKRGLIACLNNKKTMSDGLPLKIEGFFELALDEQHLIFFLNNNKTTCDDSFSKIGGLTNLPRASEDLYLVSTKKTMNAGSPSTNGGLTNFSWTSKDL
ncbi:hypothetical protein Adt_18549 [Abeliophyllum distichum]|uniref:Uncharacterized protein n=1 Tax=Abeliophyllum distichum TaxID=126358 RepID=A0ABD1TJV2_9LAMI